jgi:hypothetical protein
MTRGKTILDVKKQCLLSMGIYVFSLQFHTPTITLLFIKRPSFQMQNKNQNLPKLTTKHLFLPSGVFTRYPSSKGQWIYSTEISFRGLMPHIGLPRPWACPLSTVDNIDLQALQALVRAMSTRYLTT